MRRLLDDLDLAPRRHQVAELAPTYPVEVRLAPPSGLRRLDLAALTAAASRLGVRVEVVLERAGAPRDVAAEILRGVVPGPLRRRRLADELGVDVDTLFPSVAP